MRRKNLSTILAALLCTVFHQVATAGLPEGIAAFEKNDYGVAFDEFRPLAEQGNSEAQSRLGWMYAHGKGVKQDDQLALKWNQMAAEQNNSMAQESLAWAYIQGLGVPKDPKIALKWFRSAAENGNPRAQYRLALKFSRGDSVPRDDQEAVKWFRLSASQGYALALSDFGWVYQNGIGVTADKVLAFALYNMSTLRDASANNKATVNRSALSKMLSHDEIESGKNLSCVLLNANDFLKKLDDYVNSPKDTMANGCSLPPGKMFAGTTIGVHSPQSEGWQLVQSSSAGMAFAKKGKLAYESYAAQVSFFSLAATSNQDEFVTLIKKQIQQDTSNQRFTSNELKYRYVADRGYPCVQLTYLVTDNNANVGSDGLMELKIETVSLYCRHPVKQDTGFAVIFSHRGKEVDPAFAVQAKTFIDGVQVPDHE
jgi:hypothetical protein